MLSRRSHFDPEPTALARAHAQRAAQGLPTIDLTLSNPTRAALPVAPETSVGAIAPEDFAGYEPAPFGIASAREAVAAWMTRAVSPVDPARIVLTASTSEAYAFLLKLLCDAGDDVLVPRPSYPLLDHLCALEGVAVRPYSLRYDGRWHLPAGELARACTARTRAIIAVSPHNPTGCFLTREALDEIATLGLPLISDEVFGAYAMRPEAERVSSALGCQAPLVFSLFGLSKLVGLPQLKLSWIAVGGTGAVDQALSRLELIADTFLSVSTPVQRALPRILAAHDAVTTAIAQRVRDNLATLRDALADAPVSLLDVQGGWYATLRLPATRDDEAWALDLLEHAGVWVQPGYLYDFEDDPLLVVSLLTPPGAFSAGVAALLARVRGSLDER